MVDFKYFLNRQGPRGQQGVKGEQGYSPQITVGKDTASEFTLKIINEDGSFETENLKVAPEDRGGTYIRYDRNTYQEYIGDPDFATTEKYGVVKLATKEDLATQEESLAVSSAILSTYLQENYLNKVHGDVVTGNVSFLGNVGFVNAPSIDKIKDEKYIQYLTRNESDYTTKLGSLVIPDDDNRLKQGTKEIAYTSDLAEFVTNAVLNNIISNLVTLDTAQTITGKKNFANAITLNNAIAFNTSPALIKGSKSSLDFIFGAYDDRIMVGSQNTRTIKLNSDTITDYGGNNLLSHANIVAGNNITIEKTSTGIKISSTGGGGASDVTLAGDNSFTGNNTFDGETTFNAHTWTKDQEAVNLNVTSNATLKNASVTGTISSLGELTAVFISAAGIKNNQNNKYYLTQASVTAGSDNLVITDTTDGVQITCNAPTNAQIEALQRLMNDLSTKVDNLTTRLNNLEEVIDGGIA